MLYQKMTSEQQRLEQQLSDIQSQLSALPEGKLICTNSGKYTKWYMNDGHSTRYLPKNERSTAEKLAVKKYLQLRKQELLQEKQAIHAYLKRQKSPSLLSEHLLLPDSPYSELLSAHFTPISDELAQWASAPYDSNPLYPEQKIHKTCANILVRSKSEALITTLLFTEKIPFRYECPLRLGPATIYPDFTIRHPRTGEFYYYEHFGLIDIPSYLQNALTKLQLYISNGIIPNINLLTSFETRTHPLDSDYVEDLIRKYFL